MIIQMTLTVVLEDIKIGGGGFGKDKRNIKKNKRMFTK